MHTKDARADGETEQRLYLVSAWRESPFFNERERAALTWTEAVTLVSEDHVPDDVYDYVRQHYSEKKLVCLTLSNCSDQQMEQTQRELAYGPRQLPTATSPIGLICGKVTFQSDCPPRLRSTYPEIIEKQP